MGSCAEVSLAGETLAQRIGMGLHRVFPLLVDNGENPVPRQPELYAPHETENVVVLYLNISTIVNNNFADMLRGFCQFSHHLGFFQFKEGVRLCRNFG